MWQQEDCSAGHATLANSSGCLADLFTWTEVTVGSNVNGKPQAATFCTDYAPGCVTTGEGATSMGFYNMHTRNRWQQLRLQQHGARPKNDSVILAPVKSNVHSNPWHCSLLRALETSVRLPLA
jgi:hypothetical protein